MVHQARGRCRISAEAKQATSDFEGLGLNPRINALVDPLRGNFWRNKDAQEVFGSPGQMGLDDVAIAVFRTRTLNARRLGCIITYS
jgi:hypothetical protein